MRIAIFIILLLLIAGAVSVVYVRTAPSDPARWHVDPLQAADPGQRGILRRHETDLTPAAALARFDRVAMEAPRTERLAGSVDEGRVTYVTRTPTMRFPDYVTVTAQPTVAAGSVLVILSRQRFGFADGGTNARRLEDWLKRFDAVQE